MIMVFMAFKKLYSLGTRKMKLEFGLEAELRLEPLVRM